MGAREKYTHKDPEFVINYPSIETRTVELENDNLGELVFQNWDERRRKGFWTLDLGNQRKYIVKHFNKGYYAWLGPDAKFEEKPIAWQKGRSPTKTSKTSPTARARGRDSSTVTSEDWDASEDDATPARALRQRSRSQIMPYTAENINHKRAPQGKPKPKEDFDYDAFRPPRSTARQTTPECTSIKKRRTSSKSDTRTLTPSGTRQEATQETINKQTRFNTRLTAALTGLFEVVYLGCFDH